CGQELVLHAVRAEVALLRGVRIGVDEELIVRTRLHARAAADAARGIQIDDGVAAFVEGFRRTDPHARRIRALIGEYRKEETPRVRKGSLFDRLHPAAVHADGNIVFGLARDRARVTADALAKVYGEAIPGHVIPTTISHPFQPKRLRGQPPAPRPAR